LDSKAYLGCPKLNGFNFQNFNMSSIAVRHNNTQYPVEPFTPDWNNDMFIREYSWLFSNIGVHSSDSGNVITQKLYKNNCALFAFDFSAELCNLFHFHKVRNKLNLCMFLKF
jgi:hypothetical protein